MNKLFWIFLIFASALSSCKKQSTTQDILQTNKTIDSSLLFLENAKSDSYSDSGFYIKGEFNGRELCFSTTGNNVSNAFFVDTFMNAFFIYHDTATITNDNLYLLRQNSDESIMIAFFCGQTHIKNRSFPYFQPHSNPETCEYSSMQLINLRSGNKATQHSAQDNYTFQGTTCCGIKLTFTNLHSDNIIEGNFEGVIKTNTGSVITIKNGKLRIKFVVDDVYLQGESSDRNANILKRKIGNKEFSDNWDVRNWLGNQH